MQYAVFGYFLQNNSNCTLANLDVTRCVAFEVLENTGKLLPRLAPLSYLGLGEEAQFYNIQCIFFLSRHSGMFI